MILTILILLGIGLAVYTCILHSIGPILGILLADDVLIQIFYNTSWR